MCLHHPLSSSSHSGIVICFRLTALALELITSLTGLVLLMENGIQKPRSESQLCSLLLGCHCVQALSVDRARIHTHKGNPDMHIYIRCLHTYMCVYTCICLPKHININTHSISVSVYVQLCTHTCTPNHDNTDNLQIQSDTTERFSSFSSFHICNFLCQQ